MFVITVSIISLLNALLRLSKNLAEKVWCNFIRFQIFLDFLFKQLVERTRSQQLRTAAKCLLCEQLAITSFEIEVANSVVFL